MTGCKRKLVLSPFTRFVIVVVVAISATDVIVFYHMQKNGIMQPITWQYTISIIAITILPIVVNLWYWLIFKQRKNRR